ncbi:MAG: efflux RND transporter permease subunit [Candidatus Omnitrophica bacterium]|nr:efflux RND transporter permease subunit [Candidatus Omnitrophota bacterium]
MKLSEISVKNSLLVNIISIFIIVVGIYAMFSLRLDMFPSVDFDIVTITTVYPGAAAEDVEKFVTIPIEKELKNLSGIKALESSSDEGLSTIGIKIDPEVSDKDGVVDDIRTAVDRVRNLPEGIEEDPYVFELKSKERPILELSISGEFPQEAKRQYAEALEDRLLDIKGVASVRRIAWRDREFWVEVFPQKMAAYHVSFDEIIDALRSRNVSLPGGPLEEDKWEYSICVTGEFTTVEEIADVVIRANDAGNWLKIKDVARVVNAFEDKTHIAKTNMEEAIGMVAIKSEQADVVRMADKVKKVVNGFKKDMPEGMDATITNDFSYYVRRRLGVLKNNGLIGFLLVLGILFLFLNFIPAAMTALGIPIAIFITFITMLLLGMSINLVSMLGLIIVLGMLVDDGIIVAENTYRYIEEGMEPHAAAIRGTQEVIAPVTVAILTTCAAFAPLLFMKDIMGKFIREVPVVVMIALAASLCEAFIILPSHMAEFISWNQRRTGVAKAVPKKRKWFQGVVTWYLKLLKKALKRRYLFVFGILIPLLIGSILLLKFKVKFILFPDEGIEQFYVRAEAQKGVSLDELNELIAPVEEAVAELPPEYMDAFRTYLGSIEEERGFDPNAKRGSHLGQITVFLTPFQTRDKDAKEIANIVREKIKDVDGLEKLYISQPQAGPPVGKALSVAIKGDEFVVLQEIAAKFTEYLNTVDGVGDVDTSYQFGKKQIKIHVNEEKARQYYITVGQIAKTVRAAYKGEVATTVNPVKAEEEINVLVRLAAEERDELASFDNILIRNQFDNLVPLKAVAEVVEEEGVYLINHKDGKRVIYVTASVDKDKITSLEVNQNLQKEFKDITQDYLGYHVVYGGEFESQQESRMNLLVSFIVALSVIFIILTAMFNSLLQPFIVMLAIPFGLIGVIIAFFFHGKPLNFFALMGIVGLTGIVVNDSIVLVDFINRMRKQGKGRRESLIEAGRIRLRPVIMTTVTTIGGLVAVAYGIGGGDPFLKSMALAIIWGLFFATGLTLIVIPCIYAIMDDIYEKIFHHSMVKKNGAPPKGNQSEL